MNDFEQAFNENEFERIEKIKNLLKLFENNGIDCGVSSWLLKQEEFLTNSRLLDRGRKLDAIDY